MFPVPVRFLTRDRNVLVLVLVYVYNNQPVRIPFGWTTVDSDAMRTSRGRSARVPVVRSIDWQLQRQRETQGLVLYVSLR
jgi:hypothetical protein